MGNSLKKFENDVTEIKFNNTVLISSVDWIRPFLKCFNKGRENLKQVKLFKKLSTQVEDELKITNLIQRQQKMSALLKAIVDHMELIRDQLKNTKIETIG